MSDKTSSRPDKTIFKSDKTSLEPYKANARLDMTIFWSDNICSEKKKRIRG